MTDGLCNVMPGATWFETVEQAQEAVDVLIAVGGESHAELFWEVLRRMPALPDECNIDGSESSASASGRFAWTVENRVVKSFSMQPRPITAAQVFGLRDLIRRPGFALRVFSLGLQFPSVLTESDVPARR